MRNCWKPGKWLVIDEESGMTRYSDEVCYDAYGVLVDKRYADDLHPQDFIRGIMGPTPAQYTNLPNRNFPVSVSAPETVGNTSVPTPRGPLSHLFE